MTWKFTSAVAGVALLASAGGAAAEGELNIYNWGNYTNPDLIKKFEEAHGVKVTVTDYDSNSTALTKVKAGGHGFDIVVPSANYVPIFVKEGLLLEARPDEMSNFKNVDPKWVDVSWDPGRHYTVPWQWGTTGIAVNTEAYKGDVNTSAIFMDPPEELVGKVNFLEAQLAKTQPSPRHPVAASELQGKIHLLTASLERETQGRKREQEARQVCCPAVHAAWRSCCASRVYGAQTDKQRHDR